MAASWLKEVPGALELAVRVQPRASGDASRRKRVRVEGLGAAEAEAVMSGAT